MNYDKYLENIIVYCAKKEKLPIGKQMKEYKEKVSVVLETKLDSKEREIMSSHFYEEKTFAEISIKTGEPSAKVYSVFLKGIHKIIRELFVIPTDNYRQTNSSIKYLDLTTREYNALHRVGIRTIGDLLNQIEKYDYKWNRYVRGCGDSSKRSIEDCLISLGMIERDEINRHLYLITTTLDKDKKEVVETYDEFLSLIKWIYVSENDHAKSAASTIVNLNACKNIIETTMKKQIIPPKLISGFLEFCMESYQGIDEDVVFGAIAISLCKMDDRCPYVLILPKTDVLAISFLNYQKHQMFPFNRFRKSIEFMRYEN